MGSEKPYLKHLSGSKTLETTYEEVRAGFVALALERNRRAVPYVEQARALKSAASLVSTPAELLTLDAIQPALLSAAGISNKAKKYLQPKDEEEAIQGLISFFLEPSGNNFVEELVYRFLLTLGDTLGGSMRNVGGALAQRKLTRQIISILTIANVPIQGLLTPNNTWIAIKEENADIEIYLRGLSWNGTNGKRTLIYNSNVPLVKNNVDLCLFDCAPDEFEQLKVDKNLDIPLQLCPYIALGELKGGIDPAGADEHWKTAKTAITRIRHAFLRENYTPHLFFIGASIAAKMAKEIWDDLEDGSLSNAANLTNPSQAASLCLWLVSL